MSWKRELPAGKAVAFAPHPAAKKVSQRAITLLNQAIVAAGALVLQGTKIGAHEIWGGVPAKFLKKTRPEQAESFAKHYVEYSKWYLTPTPDPSRGEGR